tara:strand:+ start:793 stop:1302 length:510 start_codon:yes stop_codon:yes gene_type:complete
MKTKKFQKNCAQIVGAIDKKYNIIRDLELAWLQLQAELGELADALNKPRLRGKPLDRKNLIEEFADVMLQFYTLAEIYDVNWGEAVENKVLGDTVHDLGETYLLLDAKLGKLATALLNQENMIEKFADVFLQLMALAKIYDVNLKSAVESKIPELEKRHGLDLKSIFRR